MQSRAWRLMGLMTGAFMIALLAGNASTQTPATGASTQSVPPGGGIGNPAFQELDTNRDGMIDQQEAAANPALHNGWRAHDLDRNGKIDYGEFARFEADRAGADDRPGAVRP